MACTDGGSNDLCIEMNSHHTSLDYTHNFTITFLHLLWLAPSPSAPEVVVCDEWSSTITNILLLVLINFYKLMIMNNFTWHTNAFLWELAPAPVAEPEAEGT